ncbi:hypothetical protein PHYSODRAFT_518238 [Phytophthora sojae]|uniref:Uncharacterized protein n=1 Tax=Phytophthora sojae (strain P6497) TaxID=1094619 RepID=G4ZWB8_PHYSP|nr:hypothetical protein PHYSODRAFT_518238 [Phytophthora sojae]EGZ11645.1 hypothetical protein PHYSODRAFT_518238 [Phytophthora sojae]|eukprot:XP_009531978.1 hypothetical protein PHYSODRAFT_518238 [Phytophthora sojae]
MSDALFAPKRSNSKLPKQVSAFYFKPLLTKDGKPIGLQAYKACYKTRKHMSKTGYTNLVAQSGLTTSVSRPRWRRLAPLPRALCRRGYARRRLTATHGCSGSGRETSRFPSSRWRRRDGKRLFFICYGNSA